MSCLIRPATESDVPALLGLLSEISQLHHAGRPDLFRAGQKYDAPALARVLADPGYVVLVAAEADTGALYGHAICIVRHTKGDRTHAPLSTFYLDDLCVASTARGHGVGRQLIEAVRCEAVRRGCYNVTLAVWAFNERAERFYASCGFRPQYVEMEMVLGEEENME